MAGTGCFSIDRFDIIPPLLDLCRKTEPILHSSICGITHIMSLSMGLCVACVYIITCFKSPMLKRGLSKAFDTASPGYPYKKNLHPRINISQGTETLNDQ